MTPNPSASYGDSEDINPDVSADITAPTSFDDEPPATPEILEEEARHEEPPDEEPPQEREQPAPSPSQALPSPSSSYADFKKECSEQESPEQRLSLTLDFMERTLMQQGSPHFKEFWEARRYCLALFKENINPAVRSHLWNRYCELSHEARRLKEILDEQTAFAMEQIEIAIKALEGELSDDTSTLSMTPEVILRETPASLTTEKLEFYNQLQRKLCLLNAQASRIDVLREELIKTEMRVRHKNKFFERLSTAGDQVFPSRKELIKQSSSLFITDVDQFVIDYFPEKQPHGDLFALREEIKAWQSLAKQLTLNSHAFTHSRKALSECWDILKHADKERKKSRSLQRSHHKQNAEALVLELQNAKTAIEEGSLSIDDMHANHSHIADLIRRTELEREDVRTLRGSLDEIRRIIDSKEKAIQNLHDQEERQRQQARQEKVVQFKERALTLTASPDDSDLEALTAQYQQLISDCDGASLSRQERQQLERPLKALRNQIALLKDKQMFALATFQGDGTHDSRQELLADIQKLQSHRQQVKGQLEALKKQAGASSLDFSRAIELNEQIQVEKERLDNTDKALRDLNSKLRHFS